MSDKKGTKLNAKDLAAAADAFRRAASGGLGPSELARAVEEIVLGRDPDGFSEMTTELREFIELDLSDYPYSLAIHDQPAIDRIKKMIGEWAERLEREADGQERR